MSLINHMTLEMAIQNGRFNCQLRNLDNRNDTWVGQIDRNGQSVLLRLIPEYIVIYENISV